MLSGSTISEKYNENGSSLCLIMRQLAKYEDIILMSVAKNQVLENMAILSIIFRIMILIPIMQNQQ